MAKDIVKRAADALGTVDDTPLSKDLGGAMVLAGGGGLGLMMLAGIIPFVGPMLLMLLVVAGGSLLWLKGATSKS